MKPYGGTTEQFRNDARMHRIAATLRAKTFGPSAADNCVELSIAKLDGRRW